MKAKEIIAVMEKHFPLSLQEEWDKCGLQIGQIETEVSKIMSDVNYTSSIFIRSHCEY